jgi:two-component system, NtrC family, nitrogen regulation sensor histidine kinase NtrY
LLKRIPYRLLLLASLLLWAVAAWRFYAGNKGLERPAMAKTIGKDLHKREEALNKLLKNEELLRKVFAPGELSDKEVKKLQGLPFYLYAYKGLDLLFWNNNAVIIDSAIKPSGGPLLTLDRGVFVREFISMDKSDTGKTLAVLYPLAYYYPFENSYVASSIVANEHIPVTTEFLNVNKSGSYTVTTLAGDRSFQVYFPYAPTDWIPDSIMLWLLLIATLLSLIWLQMAVRQWTARRGNWALLFTMLGVIAGARALTYIWGLPFGLKNIPFFQPQLYASSWFLSSLGDVVVNTLLLLWIFFIFLRYTPYRNLCNNVKDGSQRTGLAVLFTIILVGSVYLFSRLVISLVMDSNISFELSRFGTTNTYTIMGLLSISGITGIACIFVYVMNLYLNRITGNKWLKYLLIVIATILLTIQQKEDLTKYYIGVAVWLILFVLLLDEKRLVLKTDLLGPNMVFWALFICGFSTATIQYFNNMKERQTRKSFAQRIMLQRDNVTEYTFSNIAQNIENDEVVLDFFKDPLPEKRARMTEHFDALYLSGQLKRYTARVYFFNDRGRSIPDNGDSALYVQFNKQIENSDLVIPGILFYNEYAQDGHYYLASIPITDRTTGDKLGSVYIDLQQKRTATETVYPELLQPTGLQGNSVEQSYSYAVYINKNLIAQTSDFPFPIFLRPYPRTAEFVFSEENNESSLWYKPTENRTVRVVYKQSVWIETITVFSYLFGMVMIITFLTVLYQLYLSKLFKGRILNRIRNITLSRRIHFSMLALVFISFLVIGIVTVTFFNQQYNDSNKSRLRSTMQVIAQATHEYLRQNGSLNEDSLQNIEARDSKFKYFITNLANTQKVDINLFNNMGILEMTSQDDIYNKALLARIIRPDAYRNLFLEHKSVLIQDESIGKLKYLSCYVPIRDEYGAAVGYLNVPFFASEKYLKTQISNILVTLINLYAFIFLISSIFTGFLTRWLTRTFDIIIKQFSRINLQRNERIEWPYDDEIGMLVREYNKMVKTVEENAAILAQNERESAWREMARQVAHEIKNPLTPMKLNIQYLQQALRNDHPNAKQMADKVSASLIEQIDNLSYIASEFSNFAKMPEARPEELVLNELLDVALELYLNEPTVKVRLDKTEEKLVIFSDKSQLLRVFTNLLENAVQAIPEDREGRVHVILSKDGNNALISVRDNGQGIEEEVAERIFQPYFTTKSSGTGLGLAMTKKIIEFWQGQIWFETIEGEGTTFFIRLPLVEKNASS